MRHSVFTNLLTVLFLITTASVIAQQNLPQNCEEWIALAQQYERARRYEKAAEAYVHALTLRPDDIHLNLKICELYPLARWWYIRAAESLLRAPNPDPEAVQKLCTLLTKPLHPEISDPEQRDTPLAHLPKDLQIRLADRFAPQLFLSPLAEAKHRLRLEQYDRVGELLLQMVRQGDPFAPRQLYRTMATEVGDWRRQLAQVWEKEATRSKDPALLIALLDMYWHLQDLPSIRRLFPKALSAVRGDYRRMLAQLMQEIGWGEGIKQVPIAFERGPSLQPVHPVERQEAEPQQAKSLLRGDAAEYSRGVVHRAYGEDQRRHYVGFAYPRLAERYRASENGCIQLASLSVSLEAGKMSSVPILRTWRDEDTRLIAQVVRLAARLVKEGRTAHAEREAQQALPLHPDWQEGVALCIRVIQKGVPAVVPFAQWLNRVCEPEWQPLHKCYEQVFQVTGEQTARALFVAVLALGEEPRNNQPLVHYGTLATTPGAYNIDQYAFSLRIDNLSAPREIPPPADVQSLAEYLPPQMWKPSFFWRLTWNLLPSPLIAPFAQLYPDTAVCVLYRLFTAAHQRQNARINADLDALRKAQHWHTVDWTQLLLALPSFRFIAGEDATLRLVDILLAHAPEKHRMALQTLKAETYALKQLRTNSSSPRTEQAFWQAMSYPAPLYTRVALVNGIWEQHPELAFRLLRRLLPDLQMNSAPDLSPSWHRLYDDLLSRIVKKRPELATEAHSLADNIP
ncbi:MAG: tetratricopeptide repeat protein [Armatimonadota bacterium]